MREGEPAVFQPEPIDLLAALFIAVDAIMWGQFARLRGAERAKFLVAALLALFGAFMIVGSRLAGFV
jgi:hypothetical protein